MGIDQVTLRSRLRDVEDALDPTLAQLLDEKVTLALGAGVPVDER